MADKGRKEDDTLLVVFSTGTPIGAADIADLLRDMSSDYERITGGKLVLAKYETGSSWVYLRDAIAVAGSMAGAFNDVALAVQNMRTFVRLLIDGFPNAAKPPTPPSQVALVAKSVARITKIAAEHGAYVNLEYLKDEKEGLETYTFHMNNQWARKLNGQNERLASAKKVQPPFDDGKHPTDGDLTGKFILEGETTDDPIGAIVAALKKGGSPEVLKSLVNVLEGEGRHDVSQAIRERM